MRRSLAPRIGLANAIAAELINVGSAKRPRLALAGDLEVLTDKQRRRLVEEGFPALRSMAHQK